MTKTDSEESADINELAARMGLQYQVRISPELSELLKPNPFLNGLGIQFSDRIKTVLSILKGNMIPENAGTEETMNKEGILFLMPLAKGPYIREEMISIRADLTDDDGKTKILLTAILETE